MSKSVEPGDHVLFINATRLPNRIMAGIVVDVKENDQVGVAYLDVLDKEPQRCYAIVHRSWLKGPAPYPVAIGGSIK